MTTIQCIYPTGSPRTPGCIDFLHKRLSIQHNSLRVIFLTDKCVLFPRWHLIPRLLVHYNRGISDCNPNSLSMMTPHLTPIPQYCNIPNSFINRVRPCDVKLNKNSQISDDVLINTLVGSPRKLSGDNLILLKYPFD